jgi:tetratricopeptide (TPR) repeat protein
MLPMSSADFKMKQAHLVSVIVLVLAILTLATYWRSQDHGFIEYDDQLYITKNYLTQSDISLKSIAAAFKDVHTGNWHPVTMLSHMLDWQLFGANAGGHHWTNVIIHLFNTILLFVLWRMMTGAMWRSAFVAALFAVHPINVESVAWIAERKNVLSTFFWFLTMISFVWYVRSPGWKRYFPVLICFVLGLMSKAMLVTLPFVLLLMDYWPLNRTGFREQEWQSIPPVPVKKEKLSVLILEKVPLFIMAMVFIGLTLYFQKTANAFASLESMPFSDRIANAVVSYAWYIKKLFWPTDLTVFYPHRVILIWQVSSAAIFLIAVTLLVCKYYRKYPYLIMGWFWYLGTLVPVIGLVQVGHQSMADRYAYVPLIGLFVIMAWHIPQALLKFNHSKIYTSCIFIIFIIIFSVSTSIQVGMWKDTATLFEEALKMNPENYMAYNILGSEEAGKGNPEKALHYYQMSIKLNPKYARAYSNAGNEYLKLGQYQEAYQYYQKAIAINDKLADAYYNLGVLNLVTNRPDEALVHFNKALTIMPGYFDARFNLGVALFRMGKISHAIEHFEKAVEMNPKNMEAQRALKISYDMQKKN